MNVVSIYFTLAGDADRHHQKIFTEFCKSSNHKSVNELIQLENMDRVRHGAIHMPESYGNTTKPKRCVVILSGPRNGIIIFKHPKAKFGEWSMYKREYYQQYYS